MTTSEREAQTIIPEGSVKIRVAEMHGREYRDGRESHARLEVYLHQEFDERTFKLTSRYFVRKTIQHPHQAEPSVYERELDGYGHIDDALTEFVLHNGYFAVRA